MLATAKICVKDVRGHSQICRVLIDGGSQVSIITQKCLKRLGLTVAKISLSIYGIGQSCCDTSNSVTCIIHPLNETSVCLTVDAVDLPQICFDIPSTYVSSQHLTNISQLPLADPQFNVPSSVDMLLGADIFPLILKEGQFLGDGKEPSAIYTIFGWIVIGKIGNGPSNKIHSLLISAVDTALDFTIKRLWEAEEIPETTPEDFLCEKLFRRFYTRQSTGRYCVFLPFRNFEPILGDSHSTALRRLIAL